jgi:eukaryotic-like serine/threonine-protein kinase
MHQYLVKVLLPIWLLGLALPAAAMMQDGSGRMHGMSERPSRAQPPVEKKDALGHRHGEYYHSHQGGALPHSHMEASESTQPAQEQEAAPGPAENLESSEGGQPDQQQLVLNWKDDMVLHLVPGGRLALQGDGESVEIAGFYMDETQVTNHQYVEFLNKAMPEIAVENGVVKRGDDIWLLLGEVKQGYEPIVFRDGQFSVSGVHHAACAVLRVTALGASAYAEFYGKRLPTMNEWLYTISSGGFSGEQLPIPSPVMLYAKNDYGIRGLNSNIGEWAVRQDMGSLQKNGSEYVILLRLNDQRASSRDYGIRRYPWEAFAEVGFRTVMDSSEIRESLQEKSKNEHSQE